MLFFFSQSVLRAALFDLFDRLFEEAQEAGRYRTDGLEDRTAPLDSFDLNVWMWTEQTKDVSAEEVWGAGSRNLKELNPLGRKLACLSPSVQR